MSFNTVCLYQIYGKEPILYFASEKVTILVRGAVSVSYGCIAVPFFCITLLYRDALCSRDDTASLLQSKTDV